VLKVGDGLHACAVRGMPTLQECIRGPTTKQSPKLDLQLHPWLQLPSKSSSAAITSLLNETTYITETTTKKTKTKNTTTTITTNNP
jgi:hypothetical protein